MPAAVSAPVEHPGLTPVRPRVLVGLLGRGIQLSRSPAMHEEEGAAQGMTYVYRLFDTDRLAPGTAIADILRAAEICGFAGLNVTYPYKVEVIEHLDELSPAAEAVGAVNTVVLRDGRRRGHNTDLWGFAESFRRTMAGAPRAAVLLVGAGGAGAAVAHGLVDCDVGELRIFDSDDARAADLARRVEARHGAGRARRVATLDANAVAGVDGIVNATPVGMAALPGSPVPPALLAHRPWVADIVYFPLETELLRQARRAGCRTMNGEGMAVFQAVRAFELFTGVVPDAARMRAAFAAAGGTAADQARAENDPPATKNPTGRTT